MTTAVDREKECPFLLRVFTKNGAHHRNSEFTLTTVPAADELQLYTWRNATLEELAQLIQEVIPDAQHPEARISFRLIYLDNRRATYQYKEIGRVQNGKPTPDHLKTLDQCKFFIGDYLDVAIFIGPPRQMGGRMDQIHSRDARFGPRPRFGNGGGRDRDNNRFGRDNRPPFGSRRDRF
ncbi:hypothetical protein DFQ28_001978 [Apophysomyces sp. BC1034]|nr:hypothetical protein DFQ30_002382 [Apophysomyces sp. BC1015]KAG0179917.1 hypothetical protein DFQ29_001497 [Apophysomyces sp. BC1021]KAG0190505.1 hypothetical protein DFQ28_001978 [Apophysomyces sp. BC1034]